MNTNEAASTENASSESPLPGILAAVTMLAIAAVRIVGMLAYNRDLTGTGLMLVAGAFVYLATKGYQNWRAARPTSGKR